MVGSFLRQISPLSMLLNNRSSALSVLFLLSQVTSYSGTRHWLRSSSSSSSSSSYFSSLFPSLYPRPSYILPPQSFSYSSSYFLSFPCSYFSLLYSFSYSSFFFLFIIFLLVFLLFLLLSLPPSFSSSAIPFSSLPILCFLPVFPFCL